MCFTCEPVDLVDPLLRAPCWCMGPQSDDYEDEQSYDDDSSDDDDSDGHDADEHDEDEKSDDDAEHDNPKEDNRVSYVAEAAMPSFATENSLHTDIAVHEAIVDPGCSKGMVSEDRYQKFKQLLAAEFPDLRASEKPSSTVYRFAGG